MRNRSIPRSRRFPKSIPASSRKRSGSAPMSTASTPWWMSSRTSTNSATAITWRPRRTPLDWFAYQVGMHSFRAFAQGKATWILNYSWDGDKKVDRRESMMNLAMSQIMDGANFWDAPGHSMAGSNDLATRKKIFSWIKAHEKTFYLPRSPIHPIGVYFSPQTRNYYADEFIRSYRGILILLMQKHLEFQIVTPRTLNQFKGNTLILPNVRVLDDPRRTG